MLGRYHDTSTEPFEPFLMTSIIGRSLLFILVMTAMAFVSNTNIVQAADHDNIFHFQYEPGTAGVMPIREDAGTVSLLDLTYNANTEQLKFHLKTIPPVDPSRHAKFFSFVLSQGPLPNADGGEFAIFYFDATGPSPVLSINSYNGYMGSWDSFSFLGYPIGDPDQHIECPLDDPNCYCVELPHLVVQGVDPLRCFSPADKICSSADPGSCVEELTYAENGDGSREFSFTVDASVMNNFPIAPYHINTCDEAGGEYCPAGSTFPWIGSQFGQTLGLWISLIGYPELEVSYDDSFLSMLDPHDPDGGNVEYLSLLDSASCAYYEYCFPYEDEECPGACDCLTSYREPYCEIGTARSEIEPGVFFRTTFQGTSPDGHELFVTYEDVPTGALFTPVDGSSATGSLSGEFSWTPGADQANSQVTPVVRFTEDTGREALCSLDLSVLGLNVECADVDITENQFEMDSLAGEQLYIVDKITKKYRRKARGTAYEKKAKKYRKKTLAEAQLYFNSAWLITWTIPSIQTICTDSVFCVEVSNVDELVEFMTASEGLHSLVERTHKKMKRKLHVGARKLVKQSDETRIAAEAQANMVPPVASECTF